MINYMQSCKKTSKKTLLMDLKVYNEIEKIILEKESDAKVMSKFNSLSNKYKLDRYELLKKFLKNLLFRETRFYVKEMFHLLSLVNHNDNKNDIMILHSANIVRTIME